MQVPTGILFDLDGTLLDTARDLGNTLNHMLAKHGLPQVDYKDYRNIASNGAKGLLELGFGDKLKDYNFDQLRSYFLDYYQQNICLDTVYFDGIEALLIELNQRQIPWGIVTNKPEGLTLELVKSFPLLANCRVIIGGDTLSERKPHPLPLLEAEKQLDVAKNNTWYIGDALRDIQAANAANMVSVVANFGYIADIKQTSNWQADLSIDHPLDLINYL
jgi:phosphoglycolate phosphatase